MLIDCVGDSTTRGADPRWLARRVARPAPAQAEAELRRRGRRQVRVRNRGVNGATVASTLGLGRPRLRRWESRLSRSPVDAIVINLGLNDACHGQGVHPRVFARRMVRLAGTVLRAGKQLLLETPNPVGQHGPWGGRVKAWRCRRLVRMLRRLCEHYGWPVCDHDAQIRRLPGWQRLIPDGVHPSARLYAWKGRHLGGVLDGLDWWDEGRGAVPAWGHAALAHWMLEPGIRFLNHGSFGATPRSVLAAQTRWRERLEAQPVRFLVNELPAALAEAAQRLRAALRGQGGRSVFVDNATTAVNAVLRSFPWRQGDSILVMEHSYPAVMSAVREVARVHSLGLAVAPVALPAAPEAVLAAFAASLVPGVRLAVIDHVCSPLAIVYPLEQMIALCRARGIAVCVDGAHGPGMLDLDLDALAAHWYCGNCHKWLMAPKGSAFLWAAADAPHDVRPLVNSLQQGQGFEQEFGWTGTRDPSAWLSVPAALDFLEALGPKRMREHNDALARDAAALLCRDWKVRPIAPAAMFGAMVCVPLPGALGIDAASARRLHDRLWAEHRIEIPPVEMAGRWGLRLSAQVYNEAADYEALSAAVLQAQAAAR